MLQLPLLLLLPLLLRHTRLAPFFYIFSPHTNPLAHCCTLSSESDQHTCDEAPYYTHLGAAPTISKLQKLFEFRSGLPLSAIRMEKVRPYATAAAAAAAAAVITPQRIQAHVHLCVRMCGHSSSTPQYRAPSPFTTATTTTVACGRSGDRGGWLARACVPVWDRWLLMLLLLLTGRRHPCVCGSSAATATAARARKTTHAHTHTLARVFVRRLLIVFRAPVVENYKVRHKSEGGSLT